MSKKLKALLLLSILPLALTACTLRDLPLIGNLFPEEEVPPVELSVWGLWERADIMQVVIDQFKEANPKIIPNYDDRSVLEAVEYKERAFQRAADPAGPDVLLVHNSWVPRMVASDLLDAVPTTVIDPATYNQTFYPVAADTGMVNGTPYSLPAYYDGLVLVYNKKHFTEIGQESAPTAWEEFRRLALQLSVRNDDGDLVRGGAALGSADNIDHYADILGLMWSQAGVNIPAGIDGKAAQDALTFYTNFVLEDQVWANNMPEATTAFVEDKVSMIIVPSWQILRILENVEDISVVGVAQVPQALPSRPANWASYWVYVVPKNRELDKKEAAWAYANFMTSTEGTRALFNENSKIRQFGKPFARVSMAGELAADPYLSPILSSASTAKSAEIASRSGNRRQEDAIKTAVNAVLSGDLTPEEALTEAKSAVNQ